MKQIAQRLRDGQVAVEEVPPPRLTPEGVLVDVRASLLSAGTERTKVKTGRQSLVGKARSRPDQVRQVLDKARQDGIGETVQAVRARLEAPDPLGYSAAGVVLEVGARAGGVAPGDRVACGGGGYAVHAELDQVPGNLVVPIPEGVDFAQAAFTTVGSIALHGVRQADVRLGERVAVIGLGLVGQLAGMLLRAAGCRVVGIDLNRGLADHAREFGAADEVFLRGELGPGAPPAEAAGCDAVVITAATSSSDPVTLAAELCRDRGRVVVVGDVGLEVPRAPYYDKEIDLRLSRSYGPGRYDREYEERGLDYPIGYVRWTERRNMAAFLDLLASGRIDVEHLIASRVPLEEAPAAYERLASDEGSPLGIVLEYGETRPAPPPILSAAPRPAGAELTLGMLGAGSFAQRVLIPSFKAAGFSLGAVASASGLSAAGAAERFGFGRACEVDELIADPALGVVAIATRHASHAELAEAALRAGKDVFVEKPPCLTLAEHAALRAALADSGRALGVGFNRRHAPTAVRMREHLRAGAAPVELEYRVNAGTLPPDHWLSDPAEGGGRLLGEGCHFFDFACWLVGGLPERVSCLLPAGADRPLAASQSFNAVLEFGDGSLATIAYYSGGSSKLGKERVEAHSGGRSAVIHDFDSLELYAQKRERPRAGSGKGHREQCVEFARELREGAPPEPHPLDTMLATLAAARSAETGRAVRLRELSDERHG
jgi:predicted dehydrogenase/threonine dehydrogenase-like Zn-dependent dehydrogenase